MPAIWTERDVRLEASKHALEAAWNAWRYDYQDKVEQAALANSWRVPKHRDLFAATYQEAYAQGLEAFQSGRYAIMDGLSQTERLELFERYAKMRLPREREQQTEEPPG